MASKVTVVNPWHWLNEDGSWPENIRLRNRVLRVAQCIEYGGPLARGETRETLVACRLRPGGKQCPGLLWVLKQVDDAILAFCMVCREDAFLIYEWEDTEWAEGPMEPVDVDLLARKAGRAPHPSQTPGPSDTDRLLERALAVLRSPLSPARIRELVAKAEHPTAVIHAVLDTLPRPPSQAALERFVPVLMDVWNQTPRPDLHGRTPEQMHATAQRHHAPKKVGRNAPCPCGSGKKHKRCCLRSDPLH